MNILSELKIFLSVKQGINSIKEAYMQSTHSWLSTRFWLTAATTLATIWGSVKGFIPQPYASYVEVASVGVYVIAETVHKVYTQILAAKAGVVIVDPSAVVAS